MIIHWGHWTTIRYVVACFCSYNFEGLSCIYRRRVIRGARWARGKFKGTRRLIVDFGKKPQSPCYWGGSSKLLCKFSNAHWKTHPSKPEFCDESVSCCYVSSMSIVFEVLYVDCHILCIGPKIMVVFVPALYQIRRGQRKNTRKLWSITLLNGWDNVGHATAISLEVMAAVAFNIEWCSELLCMKWL